MARDKAEAVQKFFDDFDNSTVDVQTSPGGGAITEPAGSDLILSITAGQNGDWVVGNSPIAYEPVSTYATASGVLVAECRLSNIVKTGVAIMAGLVVFDDRDNAYRMSWYDSNDDMYVYRSLGGSSSVVWQAGNYGNPATTPHIYRIYVNLTRERLATYAGVLEPGGIGFEFSTNDGTSFVFGYQEPIEIDTRSLKFGVWVRNWGSSYRGVDAYFDYLKLNQILDPLTATSLESGRSTLGEDAADFDPPQLGPPSHQAGIRQGSILPGPVSHGFDDTVLLDQHGSKAHQVFELANEVLSYRWKRPDLSRGLGEEVVLAAVLDATAADYWQERDDGDGNQLLNDLGVFGLIKTDTTLGGFGDPTANNHWGAARDGKFYADGVECAPGVFGTLAGGFDHESWRNTEEEPFQIDASVGTMSISADDVVSMSGTFAGWPGGPKLASNLKWALLAGDFDIQVDFANYSATNLEAEISMRALYNRGGVEGTNAVYVARVRNHYELERHSNGAGSVVATGGTSDASGKLRLTRVAGVYHAYYWTGSWVEIGTGYTHPLGDLPVYIQFAMNGTNSTVFSVDISNFTINAGTVSNRAGWWREATGSHRGTQQDMPGELVAVTTESSIELLDVATNKLWMRFIQGTSNVMGATTGAVRARRVSWDDGLLLVAYGTGPSSTAAGAALVIDFTMDSARWHREAVATNTGAYYRGTLNRASGGIALRNSASGGYSGDDDDWAIPDYRTFDTAIWRDAGFEYRAIATATGMAIFEWQRWFLENTPFLDHWVSTETAYMRWCWVDQSNGDLYYMDSSNLYQAPKGGGSGWSDGISGSSWTAANQKALPGTRFAPEQYLAVVFGSYVYLLANEGIYRINWPSGSWELYYGHADTEATAKVLPIYDAVTGLKLAHDGVTSLLVVGLEKDGIGQIALIRLPANTLYGLSIKKFLKAPLAVAG